jgi:hypothetical protein
MAKNFERRFGKLEKLIPEPPAAPIDLAAAAAAYAAAINEPFEPPCEKISAHEAMRRYFAMLEHFHSKPSR